ncbi:NAD-dependent dehydratase [Candidatus Woesearchaeota archaeon CG10_big_fil_rev_8_21_14_0_10_34_8]|nr:MAG: NAD-dependent dehydratase [Candidatus Woesearchaeota archaeon CG10_big_fil_rev_8_21_14_0_10_34_8]
MKVLVTGNQGYIGCVMEEMLLERGYEVIGLDAEFFKGKNFIPIKENVIKNRKNNQIIRDIREITGKDLEGCDAVIHLAALSNDPLGDLNPKLTEDINFKATVKLAEAAKEAGCKRFLYSSSCSLYGASDITKPVDETASFNPQTPYAESKVNCESALQKLADKNFSPSYMRNATAYGVSPRMRFDIVLNNLCGWAFTTGEVVMISDGKPWRPIVHIRDICAAFIAVLESPKEKIHNQAFNVGITEENFTIREIAEKVVKGIPNTTLKCLNKNSCDNRSYRVSFEKIKTLENFKPEWDTEKGIQELYKTFQLIELTKEIFEDEYFTTLKRIKSLKERKEITEELKWQN